MKIAFAANTNTGLDSETSHHFGRCPYFVFVDIENNTVTHIEGIVNPLNGAHNPGEVPAFIAQHQANVMLSGGMGTRAVQLFERMGIHAVTGASGTVRQTLERYLSGELTGAEPCADSVAHQNGNGHQH